jgi:hypothetical protein
MFGRGTAYEFSCPGSLEQAGERVSWARGIYRSMGPKVPRHRKSNTIMRAMSAGRLPAAGDLKLVDIPNRQSRMDEY